VEDVREKRRLKTDEERLSNNNSRTVTQECGDSNEIKDENV
jgi:hypothetical protein